jgi:hypothetical protein
MYILKEHTLKYISLKFHQIILIFKHKKKLKVSAIIYGQPVIILEHVFLVEEM